MDRIAVVLRKWLVTQLIAMLTIGVVTTVALLLLRVKAAFALGLLAGLFEFIPTVGRFDESHYQLMTDMSVAANRPLIALTRPTNSTLAADMTRLGLITSHAYSVIGLGSQNGELTVRLRNPWGTDGPVLYGIDDGIIEIKWSDFRRVMLGYCIG
jgi:hypothetical protein